MPSISSRPSASMMRRALRAHYRQRRQRPSSSAHKAARHAQFRRETIPARFYWPRRPFIASLDELRRASARLSPPAARDAVPRQLCAGEARRDRTARLRRSLSETVREDGICIERGGRRLLSFSCNDYLNLTHHPALKHAAIDAIERYGVGSGASRLVTGNHPLYAELEARLARLKGTEAAVRVRLGLSRQCRHHSGLDRQRRSGADR